MKRLPTSALIQTTRWLLPRPHRQDRAPMAQSGEERVMQLPSDAAPLPCRQHSELSELEMPIEPFARDGRPHSGAHRVGPGLSRQPGEAIGEPDDRTVVVIARRAALEPLTLCAFQESGDKRRSGVRGQVVAIEIDSPHVRYGTA
jgi:hypothetical protein